MDEKVSYEKGKTYITIGKTNDAAEYLYYHRFLIDEAESSRVINKNMIFVLHYIDIMFLRDESGQRLARDPEMNARDRDVLLFMHVACLRQSLGAPTRSPGLPQRKYDATTLSPSGWVEVEDEAGAEPDLDEEGMPEDYIVRTHSVHITVCVYTHRSHLLILHHFITTCAHFVYVTFRSVHITYTRTNGDYVYTLCLQSDILANVPSIKGMGQIPMGYYLTVHMNEPHITSQTPQSHSR